MHNICSPICLDRAVQICGSISKIPSIMNTQNPPHRSYFAPRNAAFNIIYFIRIRYIFIHISSVQVHLMGTSSHLEHLPRCWWRIATTKTRRFSIFILYVACAKWGGRIASAWWSNYIRLLGARICKHHSESEPTRQSVFVYSGFVSTGCFARVKQANMGWDFMEHDKERVLCGITFRQLNPHLTVRSLEVMAGNLGCCNFNTNSIDFGLNLFVRRCRSFLCSKRRCI